MRRAAVGAVVLLVGLAGMRARAAIPEVISFQGKLANSDETPVAGPVGAAFSLHDAVTGGNQVWSETYTGLMPDADGLFSAMLGSKTSLAGVDFGQPLWLEIEVGGEVLAPRFELAAAPYGRPWRGGGSPTSPGRARTARTPG